MYWFLAASFWLALSFAAASQTSELIENPEDLKPKSILEDMTIEAPAYVKQILTSPEVVYAPHYDGNQETLVFYERGACSTYGCAIAILTHDDNRLFDPVLFFSHDEKVNPETLRKLRFIESCIRNSSFEC